MDLVSALLIIFYACKLYLLWYSAVLNGYRKITDVTGGEGFRKGYRFCLPLKITETGPVFCLIQLLGLQARNI